MPGVVHGSALRARRTGLRDLALGLLTRVYARRLRVHVDAGRDVGRGAATSVGDFGRRLRAAISGGDFGRRLQPRLRAAMWSSPYRSRRLYPRGYGVYTEGRRSQGSEKPPRTANAKEHAINQFIRKRSLFKGVSDIT